ncbi:MAG TPA: nucleotidyltransferase family protein [Anaerolineaceae bacterium]|nr:nucleotidyltransferase family protein [Anaerolineaceae bacterium]
MDVILTAGGTPTLDDPLYSFSNGLPKAMIPIGEKPMIQWVLDALAGARTIRRIVMIGLADEIQVNYPREMVRIEDQGGMVENIIAGAQKLLSYNDSSQYALIAASDVPAVTPEAIDWVSEQTVQLQKDMVYTVVSKPVMEKRFPESKRSYIPLKDISICGGDINAINLTHVNYDNPMYRKLIDARKNALKQASLMGIDTLLLILFRAITLDQTEKKICKRLEVNGKVLPCPFAEIAMDVDKPGQLEMLRNDLVNL